MVFDNRRQAGILLAALLAPLASEQPIIFAVPRGGVPVAVEIARALGAPLDLVTVRKLGAPGNPELAVGAVAEDGTTVVETAHGRRAVEPGTTLDGVVERELAEVKRRVERFRVGRPLIDVHGRTVILVDDGLATGLTDLAAVRVLRNRGAGRIVVAAPVGSREAIALLKRAADQVICHTIPDRLVGVGRWYRDFTQVSDDEVLRLLPHGEDCDQASPRPAQGSRVGDVSTFADTRAPPTSEATGVTLNQGGGRNDHRDKRPP
jgi:putative phosphoribosyl transferase